jgi:hypothetical protein
MMSFIHITRDGVITCKARPLSTLLQQVPNTCAAARCASDFRAR